MIQCPNCNEQIADDSAHCGFCGHQLKGGASKTMFGMAPVGADDIEAVKKATEAARAKSEGEGGLPKPGGLPRPGGLPKPGASNTSAEGDGSTKPSLPKPGGLNLPRPGGETDPTDEGVSLDEAKTEMMQPVPDTAGVDTPANPAGATVSAPGAVGGDLSGSDAVGDTEPPSGPNDPTDPMTPASPAAEPFQGAGGAAQQSTPMWGEQATAGGGPGAGEVSSDESWGDAGGGVSSDDSWSDGGISTPNTATASGPGGADANAGWSDQGMPDPGPGGQMASSGGAGGFPTSSKKDDQKKMILYAAGGVGGLFFLCCVISIILNFVL